jgi:hypothetical protein
MAQAQNKILHMRLVEEVDAEMREFVSRRGDLSELILGMVKNVDLESVKIVKVVLCENREATTIFNFPHKDHANLKRIAKKRGCSMNALINSGIKAYCGVLRKQRRRHLPEPEKF